MTLYDRVKEALTASGVDVHDPGARVGKCTAPYAVVYDGGIIPASRRTGYRIIGIMTLTPIGQRAQLDALTQKTDAAARGMGLSPRGSPPTEEIDKDYRAHIMVREYLAPCAL